MIRKTIGALLTLCLGMAGLAGCAVSSSPSATPTPSASPTPSATPTPSITESYNVGGLMPDFTLTLLDGSTFTLSEHRGRVVVINIFATWCGPCIREMPDLQTLYDEYGDTVSFLLIDGDYRETAEQVQDFLTDNNITMPTGRLTGLTWGDYAIEFFPQTFIIDTQGVIHEFFPGMSNYDAFLDAIESAS